MSVVKPFLFLLICVFTFPGLNAFVKWTNLRATWCMNDPTNEHCFEDIPKTVEDALKIGWRKVKGSTCRNGGSFYGHRMVKNDDYAITPLYDERGFIAGVQVNTLKSELFATSNPYKFDEVPDYLDNNIESHPIYSLTTYFVDPTIICGKGRTLQQFQIEGTGSRLYVQTGKNPQHLRSIPLYRDEVTKHKYTSVNCVSTMGHHNYYDVPNMQLANCTKKIPAFLLYNNNGELHGFGQSTIGKLSSPRFEHPKSFGVKAAVDPITPECLIQMADGSPGYSNIHFFFVDAPKDFKCGPINQTKAVGNLIYINPNVFKKH